MTLQQTLEQLFSVPGDLTDGWRKKSWARFMELGLPRVRSEAFQYVPLLKFYELTPSLAKSVLVDASDEILPECKESHLVFIDGHFQPVQSKIPAGIVVLPLHAAMKSYGLFLQNRIAKILKDETDPFAALNGALQGTGVFMYIPPKMHLETPLQIAQIFTGKTLASPRVQLFIGNRANVTIIQTNAGELCNSVFDCVLDEGANCDFYEASLPSPSAWQLKAFRATLKRESRLSGFFLTTGGQTVRTSLKVQLAEENCEALLRGISILRGSSQSHVHGLVEHQAPSCRSRQHFKSVLYDESRASFEGKILVRPIAQKTEAYQSAQSLVLSDKAVSNAKPNLEIFADDVKASHGATVSQPNAEELFYLRSRGLSNEEARAMLVKGFCQELLDLIPFASLRAI